MHLHKFFHYCQLVQAGAKEVPGELVKYLKVNSACHWASFVFLQTVSKHPEPALWEPTLAGARALCSTFPFALSYRMG